MDAKRGEGKTHAEVLDLHDPTLERHRETALELVPRALQISLPDPASHGSSDVVELGSNEERSLGDEGGVDGDGEAEEARVEVAVVEGGTEVDGVVLIEDLGIQARVHSFAGTACEDTSSGVQIGKKGGNAPAEKLPPPPRRTCRVARA